ncbi:MULTISPECIES: NAD(P)H-hydrate dehydratase [Pseudomonas]|jgi:ADP-dependent NAD(P)H-hydrate dehydratase|uniref:ADP-dependent (S)-NAD(P)H-hydrate dehydratase n=1 Tax=Pseudomonas sp. Hg7Tf TaxID=3236988 RepID=A0AB39HZM2_9PSED|nr:MULTISPECIES: NAD(P)H-hydrate dehydratase [Pseudomonas]KJK09064.1 carbohydrate kinase [Pseudomonas sp. 5]MDD1975648.1 NAD(P)H-hydrate dehydratase [Pseudomonas putida]MDH2560176.1 NAD(P)H-hydrate dehydratase [Pseudomonas sp. Hg5Tf]QYX45972.1 NAD(P)H-hydrate dehydratase [Pseudomonas sp. S11A 273]
MPQTKHPANAPQIISSVTLTPLAPRQITAQKGDFGHVLVVGGDRGTGGAVLLSAEATLRCGAGLVSLATRSEQVAAALARLPEVMCLGVHSANQLMTPLERASVVVVGPGLGQAAWGRSLLSAVANARLAQVWDADALNLLARAPLALAGGSIITPHPGEAARLLGISTEAVQADRAGAARKLARKYAVVCVLKGAGTLVADPAGQLALCERGHPAMAGAGLGDVLSGVLGALLAQGLSSWDAACLGVWLHACAGERQGMQGRGLAASDLVPAIRHLLEEHSACQV